MDICGNDAIFIPSDECDECEALLARIENTYTKAEVNQMLSELEHVQMKEVSALPSTGEDNVIYLVPRSGGGYEMYVWATNHWVDLGQEEIDLSEYVKTTQLNTATEDGLVPKGTGNANKVWKTDADGVPGWRDEEEVAWKSSGKLAYNASFAVPSTAKDVLVWVRIKRNMSDESTAIDTTFVLRGGTGNLQPIVQGAYYSDKYYFSVGVDYNGGTVKLIPSWTRMNYNNAIFDVTYCVFWVYYK